LTTLTPTPLEEAEVSRSTSPWKALTEVSVVSSA
jgi:hypothetical protein